MLLPTTISDPVDSGSSVDNQAGSLVIPARYAVGAGGSEFKDSDR